MRFGGLIGLTGVEVATLLGALGGVTVLLYVLRLRRRQVQVPFSPLWAQITADSQATALFRRLRRLLSLLIQLVIVTLVALALGDPQLDGGAGCRSAPPELPTQHTVILVDASASMAAVDLGGGTQTRLEVAKDKARATIRALTDNPNHHVMVAQMDARVRPVSMWSTDAAALLEAVDAVAPGGALDAPTAVQDALDLAQSALRGRARPQTLLFTDGAFPPISAGHQSAASLAVIPVASEDGPAAQGRLNLSVLRFNVRPYLDDSLSYAIFYSVRNDSAKPVRATLLLYAAPQGRAVGDFVAPGHIVGSYALELPARGTVDDVLHDVRFSGSRLAARIVLGPEEAGRDIFDRDDVAVAVVPERRMMRVQLVTRGNLFLHASLFVRENVDFEVVDPAHYRGPGAFDVTIIDGVDVDLSAAGNYIVFAPPPTATAPGAIEVSGTVRAPDVTRIAKKHPLVRNLKLVDLNIVEMAKIAPLPGDKVAAWVGGAPLLLTRVVPRPSDAGGGVSRFAIVAFDVRQSLMPMSYAFPLMVVNALNLFYQAPDGLLKPNQAGVALSLPHNLAVTPDAAGPGRRGRRVGVEGPGQAIVRDLGDRLYFSASRTGVYEVRVVREAQETGATGETAETGGRAAEGPESFLVAINLMSAAESAITPQADGYPTWQPPTLKPEPVSPWVAAFWRVLLLAAGGLVLLEWWSWHRRVTL